MDETTAQAIDILFRSSVELGHMVDEVVRLHDLQHQALSGLHDLALEEHALALTRPIRREHMARRSHPTGRGPA